MVNLPSNTEEREVAFCKSERDGGFLHRLLRQFEEVFGLSGQTTCPAGLLLLVDIGEESVVGGGGFR